MGNLLPGELYKILLTKREIEYLKNLLSFELSQMEKSNVDPDFFERKACVSIINRLQGKMS